MSVLAYGKKDGFAATFSFDAEEQRVYSEI